MPAPRNIEKLELERLRELLDYNPATGHFTWRIRTGPMCKLDRPAGVVKGGYRRIAIDGRSYTASHLAWLHYYGAPPSGLLDHKNGNRDDNRILNLRPATHSQNSMNAGVRSISSTGLKGAHRFNKQYNRAKFRSAITVAGKKIFLGLFMTAEEAHEAYRKAAAQHHGDFARMTKEERTPDEKVLSDLHSLRIRNPGNLPVTARVSIIMGLMNVVRKPEQYPGQHVNCRKVMGRASNELAALLAA